jgi:hypothetical protein
LYTHAVQIIDSISKGWSEPLQLGAAILLC